MATKVDVPVNRRVQTKYRWTEWADGSVWLLKRGEDYTVTDAVMRACIHGYAGRHNLKAHTGKCPEGMRVQFVLPAPKKRKGVKKTKRA